MTTLSNKNLYRFVMTVFAGLLIASTVFTGEKFSLNRDMLRRAEAKYGKEAYNRLISWETLIKQDNKSSDMDKLKKVNQFFNKIRYASDFDVWGVEDYWATPVEFLCKGAGDCEDYAIAKFFTLVSMGMSEEKLKITYVKAIQHNINHMVLTYYSDPEAEPLVLDNMVDSINPGSKRTDLMPIFGFNGSGLWMAKQRGQGKLAGNSSRLKLWQEAQKKMTENIL